MTPNTSQPGNRSQLILCSIIFVLGFLSGVAFTVYKSNSMAPSASPTATASGEQPHQHDNEIGQAIHNIEAEVTANPDNFKAWTQLGNLYYDTDQATKAIAAYNKSLELHKGDANLLTDLGVMYRKDNQPKKALELFDKAIQEDPTHMPSRYNKGIVLYYDLSDPQGAIASWEGMLTIDPQAKTNNGMAISEIINQLKAEAAKAK
ncbi:MAG: tetratricopeptide repeat protein [Desulforhopalus sp.]|nr:tetratricopeptide repeat protein [Desulforhopalus sp.]